jgi:hypothetical protein
MINKKHQNGKILVGLGKKRINKPIHIRMGYKDGNDKVRNLMRVKSLRIF